MELSATGPSSSDSRPSTSSSSGPAAVDSSGSKPEDSQQPGQEVDIQVVSLLNRLKLPRPSDFARKGKIAANPVLYMFVIVRKGHFVEKKKNGHNGHFLQHNLYIS